MLLSGPMSRNNLRRELPTYKREGSSKRIIQNIIFIIFSVFFLTSVFQCTIARSVAIRSISMAPTLHQGDFLFCSPLTFGKEIIFSDSSILDFGSPHRGDLVLLRPSYHVGYSFVQKFIDQIVSFVSLGRYHYHPGVKLQKDWESSDLLRRVIALPGDEIYMNNDRFFVRVKGKTEFVDEFLASGRRYSIKDPVNSVREHDMVFSEEMPLMTVPAKTCFVAADNRDAALDSRHWGVVEMGSLRGQVLVRYWPLSKFGLVH